MPSTPLPKPSFVPPHDPPRQAGRKGPAANVHEHVLAAVAARICNCDAEHAAPPADAGISCLQMLCEAVVTSETAFDAALAQLRRLHGVSDEEIVDCYIPATACQLGADWAGNSRSFAEVTIGTARLTAAVRQLSRGWAADTVADWRAPGMAMVVPETEQHRLGAMIAASRFRRLGVSVQLLLGRSDAEVVACIRDGSFDLVSFSLATEERVEQTRRLIQKLRDAVPQLPPLVAGGAVGVETDELKLRLGADHVVSDPEEALRLCGVRVRARKPAGPRAKA